MLQPLSDPEFGPLGLWCCPVAHDAG